MQVVASLTLGDGHPKFLTLSGKAVTTAILGHVSTSNIGPPKISPRLSHDGHLSYGLRVRVIQTVCGRPMTYNSQNKDGLYGGADVIVCCYHVCFIVCL